MVSRLEKLMVPQITWVRIRAKVPRFGADDGDAYGCLFFLLGHRCGYLRRGRDLGENPIACPCGLADGGVLRPYLLGGIVTGRLHHDVKLPRLWHGVDSLVVYDLIVTFLGTHYVLEGSVLHIPK
jgi:hypothetical protein